MLQLFRNFFRSKIGIVVTLAFLGLIAFAFASMDVPTPAHLVVWPAEIALRLSAIRESIPPNFRCGPAMR